MARAADESAELAELHGKLTLLAEGAEARVLDRVAFGVLAGEHIGAQRLVQRVEHGRDAQVFGAVDVGGKLLPEFAQEGFPVELAIGDDVEFFFQACGEVIFHIAAEEVFEEGGDEAALVFRHERLALNADIAPVFQRRHGRGVGGGAADAEFFKALDQRGFGVARGRLGEGLVCVCLEKVCVLTFRHLRQAAFGVVVVIAGVVAFGVELDVAVKHQHLAGGAQAGALVF